VLNNVLVLCPASVISVWQSEITTWAPRLVTSNAATTSPDETTANITLASYSIAKLRKTVMGHAWDAIILDECHALKNRKSQQSKYVRQLAKRNPKALLVALSGTPYSNNVSDIWPVLHCIDPAGFPSFQRFANLYCDTVQGPYSVEVTGISASAEKEFELATGPYIRRVAKSDVAAELPPKRYQVVEVALSDGQRKAYDETSAELATLTQSGETVTAATALTQLTRLLQYCSATPTGIDTGTGRLRLAAPSSKIDALVELARQREAEPIVVFCTNVDVAELAAQALTADGRNVGVLSGRHAPVVRGATVKAFQAGELDAVVATLAVGGQGITLTRSRTAIFLQRSWSFVESVQAEDRIHRLSSVHHESVEIIDVVAAGTVETEKLLPVVRGKYKLVADILAQYTG
jgi:SNF2 family DNA or RNA helicase